MLFCDPTEPDSAWKFGRFLFVVFVVHWLSVAFVCFSLLSFGFLPYPLVFIHFPFFRFPSVILIFISYPHLPSISFFLGSDFLTWLIARSSLCHCFGLVFLALRVPYLASTAVYIRRRTYWSYALYTFQLKGPENPKCEVLCLSPGYAVGMRWVV